LPPNAGQWDCTNQQQQKAAMSARSRHAGGVNLLLVDGSVDFITNEVDISVWQATSTRAGSEAIVAN
jgi:prepilin-type processing-associated H-X9-DG protein